MSQLIMFSLNGVMGSVVGAFIFLLVYELLLKNFWLYFLRFKSLVGYYVVCSKEGDEFLNSPEGIPNCLYISINFWKPSILKVRSKDFDRTYSNNWKTWGGMISMDINFKGHGSGYYIYDEGSEPGLHEIFLKENKDIMVRITDFGRANLDAKTDNIPSLQIWRPLGKEHPRFDEITRILKA